MNAIIARDLYKEECSGNAILEGEPYNIAPFRCLSLIRQGEYRCWYLPVRYQKTADDSIVSGTKRMKRGRK